MLVVFQGLQDCARLLSKNAFFTINFDSFQIQKYLLKILELSSHAHNLIKLLKIHTFTIRSELQKTVKKHVVLNFPRMIYGGKATLASSVPNLNICKIFYLLYKQLKPLAYFYCRKYLSNRVGFRVKGEFANSTNRHRITSNPYHFLYILSFRVKYSLVWGQSWRDSPLWKNEKKP